MTARLIKELDEKKEQIRDRRHVKSQAEEGKFLKKSRYLTELVRADSSMDTVELEKDLDPVHRYISQGIGRDRPGYTVCPGV